MIAVYTLEQADEWDGIVRSFREYDVYWLSGYAKGFQIHGDGDPMLFYYDDRRIRGINVVMKRDVADDEHLKGQIPAAQYFDFATPYGYGGWIMEGNGDVKDVFLAYEEWIRKHKIVSEFVRFHPMLQNQANCGSFYKTVQLGEVVHLDLSSPELIWGNMTSKNRGHVRKAVKSGVAVYNGRYPEIFREFRQMYDGTMDKDNAERYYYFEDEFYRSVLDGLPENAQIFYAELEGRVIAAAIILAADRRLNYHLSGSLQECSGVCATNLLLYKVALWGCANGYRTLYLGGGVGSGEDGLFKFKRAFYKGDLNRFYVGQKIYDEGSYRKLVGIRGEMRSQFFPLYRASVHVGGVVPETCLPSAKINSHRPMLAPCSGSAA